jgi:hypothetical protein
VVTSLTWPQMLDIHTIRTLQQESERDFSFGITGRRNL